MKGDFRGLECIVQGAEVQVMFCSIPSGVVKDMEQARKTQVMSNWLRGWCQGRYFGIFDHGEVYSDPSLLSIDETLLSQRGKRILVQELAGLTERILNYL